MLWLVVWVVLAGGCGFDVYGFYVLGAGYGSYCLPLVGLWVLVGCLPVDGAFWLVGSVVVVVGVGEVFIRVGSGLVGCCGGGVFVLLGGVGGWVVFPFCGGEFYGYGGV